jgi:hypothetical protein
LRRIILLALLAAACDSPVRHLPDAKDIDARMADAPADAHVGSAMRWIDGIDPNPSDSGLELGVFAISLVVAVGPIRARRRRKAR